ncbi:MAG: hypothetical protein WCK85_11285 [Chlorobium sp.]
MVISIHKKTSGLFEIRKNYATGNKLYNNQNRGLQRKYGKNIAFAVDKRRNKGEGFCTQGYRHGAPMGAGDEQKK